MSFVFHIKLGVKMSKCSVKVRSLAS